MIEDLPRANTNLGLEIKHTKIMAISNGYKKPVKVHGNSSKQRLRVQLVPYILY